MNRVFVYGTLRRGQANHDLLSTARFVRHARTTADYCLADLGAFPALVVGGSTAVHGEVYDVNDEVLATLDELEEHPEYYRRETIRLEDGDDVMAYLLEPVQVDGFPIISTGDWVNRP